MKRTLLTIALVAAFFAPFALPAHAQTGAIASYRVQFYQPGVDPVAGAPFTIAGPYAVTSVACNQPAPAPIVGAVVNPRRIVFDDVANVGKVCVISAPEVFAAMPIGPGPFTATATATDDFALTSARSAASNPFQLRGLPAVLTGVRVLP